MRVAAVLLAVLLVSSGCGDESERDDRAAGPRPGTEADATAAPTSSPFAVDAVPAGWIPVGAGRGTYGGDWGSDTTGSTEPFTIVAPEDETPTSDNVVEVAYTALDGMVEIDEPRFSDDDRYGPPSLLVPAGDRTYLQASGVGRSRDELEQIIEGAQPVDEVTAPEVEPLPGWDVVGSVDTDAILALGAGVHAWSDVVPGPPSGHAYGWVRPDGELSVVSIPGDRVDLEALEVGWTPHPDGPEVVWRVAPWGDVLFASSSGPAAASAGELDALLESARQVDQAAWEQLVVAATGGPGLQADPVVAVELARGTNRGVEWLFQAFPGDINNRIYNLPAALPTDYHGDPCLKLSTRRRLCADHGAFGGPTSTLQISPTTDVLDPFVVVNTKTEAAAVRLTQGDLVQSVPLARLPGSVPRWAAVVFSADGSPLPAHYPDCGPTRRARLELVDEAGRAVLCLAGP